MIFVNFISVKLGEIKRKKRQHGGMLIKLFWPLGEE
jgi:hypothetical protein